MSRPDPLRDDLGTWIGFCALCAGMFMAILDVQIVAIALPTIQDALEVTPQSASWVQTAYLLAEVVSIPLTGPLTRLLGVRRLVVAALLGFTAASLGCAASPSLPFLLAWRLYQGFAGGVLIPVVFSSVFLLFPRHRQPLATALAGILAVLAPTVGPLLGGAVTAAWSWHGLFLINLAPGLITTMLVAAFVPRGAPEAGVLRRLDVMALGSMACGLGALVVGLKEAVDLGWGQTRTLATLMVAGLALGAFVRRTLAARHPVVALRLLADRTFAIACLLSFVFGAGLFGSVYLMPVFLGYVRGHDPLEIGRIMLVTGVAQLGAAPVVAALEPRVDARWLTAAGFVLFAAGLGLGAGQTLTSDAGSMVWPQILRGIGIMLCLVPTTRLAMDRLAADAIPDASGLFNLMRNLGGVVGLSIIATILYGRAPTIAAAIAAGLRAGDPAAAVRVGLSPALLAKHAAGLDARTIDAVRHLVEREALTEASNEAWALLALVTLAAALTLAAAGRSSRPLSAPERPAPPWWRPAVRVRRLSSP